MRFVATELLRFDGRPRTWKLKGHEGVVVLRSGTSDVDIFEEIFVSHIYDPPPVVTAALNRQPVELIADLGGNAGLFATHALDRYRRATVVSFEPDPKNLMVINSCREQSPFASRWEVKAVAAGAVDGNIRFLTGKQATSRRLEEDESGGSKTCVVPIADCFSLLARADLIKIDIEGGEWPILEDPRFASLPTRAIALEYHAEHGPDGCTHAARRLLGEAGYHVQATGPRTAACGQLWAWRP